MGGGLVRNGVGDGELAGLADGELEALADALGLAGVAGLAEWFAAADALAPALADVPPAGRVLADALACVLADADADVLAELAPEPLTAGDPEDEPAAPGGFGGPVHAASVSERSAVAAIAAASLRGFL